jgi:hypothetical protein
MLKNSTKKMKIFQVKYNQEYYSYYQAESKELFNDKTNIYKSYTDCKDDIRKIEGYEYIKISESLLSYFKNKKYEF